MADNRVQVDLVAENADLRAKLTAAEADLEGFKNKAVGSGKRSENAFKGVNDKVSAFSRVLRLVTFPLVAVTAAARFVDLIHNATENAKAFQKEASGIADTFSRGFNLEAIGIRFGEGQQAEAELVQRAADAKKKVVDAYEATLADKGRILRGKLGVLTGFDLPADKLAEQARNALQSIDQGLETARKNLANKQKAEREKNAADAKVAREKQAAEERRAVESVRSDISSTRSEMASTEQERLEIETQEKLAAIRRRYIAARSEEEKGLLAELQEMTLKAQMATLEKMASAQRRQYAEMSAEARRAQEQGFGLSAGAPAFAGTGTALQFLQDNIVSFARTASGGR